MQELMQGYAAAFIEAPHAVHEGGKGYLTPWQVPRRMFADDHDVGFYFCAGLLVWRARQTFASLEAWRGYAAKHQLVFALRTLADPPGGLPMGRRDGEAHTMIFAGCGPLCSTRHVPRLLAAAAKQIVETVAGARRQGACRGPSPMAADPRQRAAMPPLRTRRR